MAVRKASHCVNSAFALKFLQWQLDCFIRVIQCNKGGRKLSTLLECKAIILSVPTSCLMVVISDGNALHLYTFVVVFQNFYSQLI